ncbi:class I SAM-dependent methyltransferase [Pullulanibacillus sp. KACC 23026]|uniref:class I SAM-dependent methyltransferase n=1 Tax=Pullulanibacillus sp. KACC 23026 TaxID=3028315 RepID=UPI0023AFDB07|nr:class I SAM-dependent methyltransferase [Pullulanibacillus sp. KACC 23026]WEG14280.1 class I SAM-dependent methyltransferase [Pullulanibacillus sp. KACC 23026]
MSNKQYLDFLAKFGISSAHPGGFPLTKALLEDAHLTTHHHVLDVGCGTGETSVYMAKMYKCKVTAIDLHPEMIAHAKKRIQSNRVPVHLVQGDVQQLPFEERSFDAIFAESVTVFTDYKRTLKEYARVLKSGGVLYDVEMTSNRPLHPLEEEEIKRVYQIGRVPTEVDWRIGFEEAGFKQVTLLSPEVLLKNQPQTVLPDASQFDFSQQLDLEAFNTWLNHIQIMDKYRHVLSYRIYKASV